MLAIQELLILSFFDRTIPREMKDKDLTAKMIVAGIGKNKGSPYPYYEIIHQLSQKDLLEHYRDPAKKGMHLATGPEVWVLTEMGELILKNQ